MKGCDGKDCYCENTEKDSCFHNAKLLKKIGERQNAEPRMQGQDIAGRPGKASSELKAVGGMPYHFVTLRLC